MKKLIILLMAGLMIMPACQNSSKESSDQIALQIKLLSQSLKENTDQYALQAKIAIVICTGILFVYVFDSVKNFRLRQQEAPPVEYEDLS